QGVGNLQVTLPLFVLVGVAGIHAPALHVTSHELQARHAVLGKVQVVAQLSGFLILGVEVGTLDGVGQPDAAAAVTDVVVIRGVARRLLVGNGEGMSADTVSAGKTPDGVVLAATGTSVLLVVLGAVDVEVEAQVLAFSDIEVVVQVAIVFLGNIFVIGIVQRGCQIVGEAVGTANNIDALQDACVVAIAASLILSVHGSEVTGVQFQTGDFIAGQQEAFGSLWQQAAVVGAQNRQSGELGAVLQHGIGYTQFYSTASFGIVVLRATVAAGREQAGACTALAAVKLQAQQADGVNTETDSALGEAGFEGADEAQAPF